MAIGAQEISGKNFPIKNIKGSVFTGLFLWSQLQLSIMLRLQAYTEFDEVHSYTL